MSPALRRARPSASNTARLHLRALTFVVLSFLWGCGPTDGPVAASSRAASVNGLKSGGHGAKRLRVRDCTEGDASAHVEISTFAGDARCPDLVAEAGRWADRLSVNIEMSRQADLDQLAPVHSSYCARVPPVSLRRAARGGGVTMTHPVRLVGSFAVHSR